MLFNFDQENFPRFLDVKAKQFEATTSCKGLMTYSQISIVTLAKLFVKLLVLLLQQHKIVQFFCRD